MAPLRIAFGIALLTGLAACTGGTRDALPAPSPTPWDFAAQEEAIVSASCPGGARDSFSTSILLDVTPVAPGPARDLDDALDGLAFVGGWALETPYASFGGLSGLKVRDDGSLLAVSDSGALIALPFDQAGIAPESAATIMFLTNETGAILTGKSDADAEGLEVRGRLVLVSFERNHRIAAYAYDLCGSLARAVPVARMTSRPAGLEGRVGKNAGAEALALDGNRVIVGLETIIDGASPLGEVRANGTVSFEDTERFDAGRMPLVGMDVSRGVRYSLHRAYNPVTGSNSIRIYSARLNGAARRLADLHGSLILDNFEGIAVLPLDDGRDRVFIISDNNFSDDQRTLLYVFETLPG